MGTTWRSCGNTIEDESVDLCYIDPPFNSKRNYNQIYNNIGHEDTAQAQAFVDTWTWDAVAENGLDEIKTNKNQRYPLQTVYLILGLEKVLGRGSFLAYLVSMTLRVNEIRRVLKPTGSFYLHCDPTASHYLKIILDSLFCANGGEYRNEIIWKRKAGRGETNNLAIRFGVSNDIIFFYAKSQQVLFRRQYRKNSADYIKSKFTQIDENGRFYHLDNLTSPSFRPNLKYEYKGYKPPEKGWAVSLDTMKKMDAEGRIYFPKDKTKRLRRKRFLDELIGETVDTLWDDISPINSQAAERLGYPTQKPEGLLERIINASSNEGDVVFDAFCGCGTTVAVAQKLRRNWIGIDITYQSISLILKRLEDSYGKDVLDNIELTGVPVDRESAVALSLKADDKTRKEFEKWAVLTYSNNRAMIHEKKGSDKGIDGVAFAMTRAC
jgi:site-specific DNA-methyltransferase (adenine-specific)